jgi:hypothetical protein
MSHHLRFPLVLLKRLRDVALIKPEDPTDFQKWYNPPVAPIADTSRSHADFRGYFFLC